MVDHIPRACAGFRSPFGIIAQEVAIENLRTGAAIARRADVRDILKAVVGNSNFAVMLAEPCAGGLAEELRVQEVSKGFEEVCGWPRLSLVGGSGRLLDARALNFSIAEEARLRMAYATGAPFSCVRTIRKASGEFAKVYQHVCGVSVGTSTRTGESMWYLLSIHIDVTEDEDGLPIDEEEVDLAFLRDAAIAIGRRLLSDIANKLAGLAAVPSSVNMDGDDTIRVSAPTWRQGNVDSLLVAAGVEL